MFKIFDIQAMDNLSDERVEFLVNDRMSFMRFLGLTLADRVPDARTIWLFREKLGRARSRGCSRASTRRCGPRDISPRRGRSSTPRWLRRPRKGRIPEGWKDKPAKLQQKDRDARWPEIAIEEIDRVIASGVRFGCVLADSGYDSSGPFRQALSARGLLWAVGLSRRQNVYPADVALVFPIAKVGKPRKYHIPEQPPVSAEAALADA